MRGTTLGNVPYKMQFELLSIVQLIKLDSRRDFKAVSRTRISLAVLLHPVPT